MVNINKLTKGFKLKINKKKKSNWRTLNSRESLPQTPTDEYMLYSDTEAELYQAKVNVEANRSFVSYNNNSYNNNFNKENFTNTNNILAGLNSNNNFVSRSKTSYTRPTTNNYTYNNSINNFNHNNNNNINTNNTQLQSSYLYPGNKTSSSSNNIQYTSAPNSPVMVDSFDTYANDYKISNNNPFKMNINTNVSTINPKATMTEINTQLNMISNNDPAYSHTLVSPIEFDGSGKEIKPKASSNNISFELNNNTSTATETTSHHSKEHPSKSKSIKKLKPLITFDIPPVVTPMAAESDSDEVGHRRRSKKNKKYSKKRYSPSLSNETYDSKEDKKSAYIYGNDKGSYEPSSAISTRTNRSKSSPTEEDDDVPLGIIQYKCLSSLLQESAPPNISSLQSNTKSYKSSHLKDSYGYISPSEYCSKEKYGIPKYINYSNYYHENYVI